jgi:hypothetical protein
LTIIFTPWNLFICFTGAMIALKLHCVPNIPSFHVGGTKPVSVEAAWFQYIIEIPRHYNWVFVVDMAPFCALLNC